MIDWLPLPPVMALSPIQDTSLPCVTVSFQQDKLLLLRKDSKQLHDDYDNMKSEAKVLNDMIERLQGVEGSNSELQAQADKLR